MNTKEPIECVVIGSGPSAVGAIAALIEMGVKPLVLEAGNLYQGGLLTRKNLNDQNLPLNYNKLSAENKTWFGSQEPYRKNFEERIIFSEGVNPRSSNFVGGYSRVWGATFKFWDLDDRWPHEFRPTETDYLAIKELVPNTKNPIEKASKHIVFRAPGEFQNLYQKLSKQPRNWKIEPSVLAVQTLPTRKNACLNSGTCLTGCPNDAIWYAGDQIFKWFKARKIELITNTEVYKIQNSESGHVRVVCRTINKQNVNYIAKKVFVAAGALGTAEIALNSGIVDHVEFQDTATIFTAALSLRKGKHQGHKLSQIWISSKTGTPFLAQLYPPDINNASRLQEKLKSFPFPRLLAKSLISRTLPVIAYIDPSHSQRLRLERSGNTISASLVNKTSSALVFAKLFSLNRLLARNGIFIPLIGTEISTAGSGHHFGCSFPIGNSSDGTGQIKGWRNIHVIDSSVLPYMQVGSVTPTVMANAHRIARESYSWAGQ